MTPYLEHIAILAGTAAAVLIITSLIHHIIGKIKKWWHPKWGAFFISLIIAPGVLLQFIVILEPLDLVVLTGFTLLVYLCAAGLNTVLGKSIDEDPEAKRETWRNRWFD